MGGVGSDKALGLGCDHFGKLPSFRVNSLVARSVRLCRRFVLLLARIL